MTSTVLRASAPAPRPSRRRLRLRRAAALLLAVVFVGAVGVVGVNLLGGGERPCPPGADRFAEPLDPGGEGIIATVRYEEARADVTPPWQRSEAPDGAPERIRIAEAPPCGPELALRAEVRAGDTERDRYHRAEVYWRHPEDNATQEDADDWPDPIGTTRWYGFSVYFPEDHENTPDDQWLVITQLKGFRGGSPPVAIEEREGRLELTSNPFGKRIDLGPIRKGRWEHLALGVHRDTDDDGWVEVWRDGERAGGWEGRTMERQGDDGPPDPTYFKLGVYRSDRPTPSVVWFGPLALGDTRQSVTPD